VNFEASIKKESVFTIRKEERTWSLLFEYQGKFDSLAVDLWKETSYYWFADNKFNRAIISESIGTQQDVDYIARRGILIKTVLHEGKVFKI